MEPNLAKSSLLNNRMPFQEYFDNRWKGQNMVMNMTRTLFLENCSYFLPSHITHPIVSWLVFLSTNRFYLDYLVMFLVLILIALKSKLLSQPLFAILKHVLVENYPLQ